MCWPQRSHRLLSLDPPSEASWGLRRKRPCDEDQLLRSADPVWLNFTLGVHIRTESEPPEIYSPEQAFAVVATPQPSTPVQRLDALLPTFWSVPNSFRSLRATAHTGITLATAKGPGDRSPDSGARFTHPLGVPGQTSNCHDEIIRPGASQRGELYGVAQKSHPLHGSERVPLPGARMVGAIDPHELILVTVLVRRRSSSPGLASMTGRKPARTCDFSMTRGKPHGPAPGAPPLHRRKSRNSTTSQPEQTAMASASPLSS